MITGTPPHKTLIAVAIVVSMAVGFACTRSTTAFALSPDTTFNLLDEGSISLASRAGSPTLVVFFALNNPLAIDELKRLEKITREFSDQGLEMIAVAQSSDRPELVRTVMHNEGMLFDVAMDPEGATAAAFGGLSTTPTSYLVSPQGEVIYAAEGPMDLSGLHSRLTSL